MWFGEGGTLQTNITGVYSQWFSHTGFAPAYGMCVFPVCTAWTPGCSAGNCLKQALFCMYFPGLSHAGSGSWVLHKGTDLVGPVFYAHPRSEQAVEGCDICLPPSQLLGFLGVIRARLLRCAVCLFWGADLWLCPSRRMLTVQNPKKSWLARKPACSLEEDASLEPQLAPSGSGCPHLPVSGWGWAGPQPASSAQSFVLWAGLAVS